MGWSVECSETKLCKALGALELTSLKEEMGSRGLGVGPPNNNNFKIKRPFGPMLGLMLGIQAACAMTYRRTY